MNLSYALNTFTGPALIIIIIFAECMVKFSSNRKLRKIFCIILVAVFVLLIADFIYSFYSFDKSVNHLTKYRIIWSVIAALFLFTYLFVILKENKTDYLTGLDNRYSFFEFVHKFTRNKSNKSLIIAMIDIINFKLINETYGNLEGDNALRNFAQIIKFCVRKTDFAARYGGDEFVLAVRTETGIDDLLDKINESLNLYDKNNGKPYEIKIIYGFDTYFSDDTRRIDDFLNHINNLMHLNTEEKRRAGDYKL
jgi:diguanylate cyclase (GGDEF)-like protein